MVLIRKSEHKAGPIKWCGRGDLNPHRPCGPTDFLTIYGFRRARESRVCGLDYPFTVAKFFALGAARLVSTPSFSPLGL